MNQTQKIIKYIAIFFAIFLIVGIASLVTTGVITIVNIFSDDNVSSELKQLEINGEVKELEINSSGVNLIFEVGESFKIETNNKYIRSRQNGNKLVLEEKKHYLFNKGDSNLIVTVPTDLKFNKVSIETGAGKVDISGLSTNLLSLDLGAGKVFLSDLNVSQEAEIDGGAGEIVIENSIINNLDLDMGVGSFGFNATLIGNNSIDAGVGNVNLKLNGSLEDYKIKIDKALGNATIDNERVTNNTFYGNGQNSIDIDGGVGNIKIELDDIKTLVPNYVRTYTVLNITPGQIENEYYVTLQQFQGEVATVIINTIEILEENKIYEFHFARKSNDRIDDKILSIFENSTITDIIETDKEGLEQIQDAIN